VWDSCASFGPGNQSSVTGNEKALTWRMGSSMAGRLSLLSPTTSTTGHVRQWCSPMHIAHWANQSQSVHQGAHLATSSKTLNRSQM